MTSSENIATHTVRLFDDANARIEAIVGFVHEGLRCGDSVLVIATREHWELAAGRLLRRGPQLDADIASYRLTVCDASALLDQFMRGRTLHANLFDEAVGARVHRLRAAGSRLRAYGEMVDLLARNGDFQNALRLESLWNDLLREAPVDLLCAYSSIHFDQPANSGMLPKICHLHSYRC